MSPRRRAFLVLGMLLGAPAVAAACLWDYDTLKQERSRFPSALELVTGKFLRHSKEFYEWRVQDRLYKLSGDPTNLAYHDDLAVAYQKTGQTAKAIETMLAKEKLKPGVYETYSNLGTFHILAGDLERGLPYIDKALAINPDAHFGREKYQKWLVEYAIEKRKGGKLAFPMHTGAEPPRRGFNTFLAGRLGKPQPDRADIEQAVTGVLGMMRFANHDNPLLLEALGDLLLGGYDPTFDAKRMAARAYLKASYEFKDEPTRQAYRTLAEKALDMQTVGPGRQDPHKLADLEPEFRAELADADRWYAALRDREVGWIRDGHDPEAEFDRLYTQEPRVIGEPDDPAGRPWRGHLLWPAAGGAVAVLLVGFLVARRGRRRAAGA